MSQQIARQRPPGYYPPPDDWAVHRCGAGGDGYCAVERLNRPRRRTVCRLCVWPRLRYCGDILYCQYLTLASLKKGMPVVVKMQPLLARSIMSFSILPV